MNRVPRRPLPLDSLRAFEAVARRLSFSAAAEEMHLTQPAVSRQIKGLEDELGAPLFHRATRRVELTAAGLALQRVVEPTLARLDACVRQIRMSRSRAMVSVTTFPSFASLWLMPRMAEFERDHPSVDIRIAASDRIVEADDIELDLALRYCPVDRIPPGSLRLFGEVLSPVIGTRLADAIARGEAPALDCPADLAQHTLLEMDDGTAHAVDLGWPAWLAGQRQSGLTPRRWITFNYTNQQVQAALSGQGVALARLALVHDMVQRGDLIEPFGLRGRRETERAFWLSPLAGAGHPPRAEVRAFADWVTAQSAITRTALGEEPDSDLLAHAD